MVRADWHTLLESLLSLISHPRKSSFGLPNKKLWSVYWKLLWRPTVTRSHFWNPFRGDPSHCLPSETLFRFHTYLAGFLLVQIPPKTHYNLRLLMIEIYNPLLFSCVLTNIQIVFSTPLLLISSRDYIGGGLIRFQLVLLLPSRYSLIDCRLCWLVVWECGWANPRFRLRLKTVVGFEFYLPGCTSYRCLQQVIRLFFG